MVSPTSDRRFGVVGSVAQKAPVHAVATTPITLSGQQTIDGVALLAVNAAGVADRVLVTGQANAVDNGIYTVSTAAWARAIDADGPYDLVKGTQVNVTDGTTFAGTGWLLTTADPITIGTTALTWEMGVALSDATSAAVAAANAAIAVAAAASAAASLAAAQAIASGKLVSSQRFVGTGSFTIVGPFVGFVDASINGNMVGLTVFSLVGATASYIGTQFPLNSASVVRLYYTSSS
jgi:phage-related tail fiber protein